MKCLVGASRTRWTGLTVNQYMVGSNPTASAKHFSYTSLAKLVKAPHFQCEDCGFESRRAYIREILAK